MLTQNLLARARDAAGLSQTALAKRAGTSRPTLSAYEHGRKSPTLDAAARIVREAGFDLAITPRIEFHEVAAERGSPIQGPNALLVDLWDELVLPPGIRAAWNGVVTGVIEERVA